MAKWNKVKRVVCIYRQREPRKWDCAVYESGGRFVGSVGVKNMTFNGKWGAHKDTTENGKHQTLGLETKGRLATCTASGSRETNINLKCSNG